MEGGVVMILGAGGVRYCDLYALGCDGIERCRRGYVSEKSALKDGDI